MSLRKPKPKPVATDDLQVLHHAAGHDLEHPLFALAPSKKPFNYVHGDYVVEVRCGAAGRATVHDKDIWIFCISQLMSGRNAGKPIARTLRFRVRDYLITAKRGVSGAEYQAMAESLLRLKETSVLTNLITGGRRETAAFGLVDSYRLVEEADRTIAVELMLPDWLFRAIVDANVLTLDDEYFRIRKPVERRLYELGRKHCGGKIKFAVGLELLRIKVGSCSPLKEFRRQVIAVVRDNALPQYRIHYDRKRDMVVYYSRSPEGHKAYVQDTLTLIRRALDVSKL